LIQTAGRAARNVNSRVILYGDTVTGSMREMLQETQRRREVQRRFNEEHGITPQSIVKALSSLREGLGERGQADRVAEGPVVSEIPPHELPVLIDALRKEMKEAAAALEFELAAELRDRIQQLELERLRNT